MDRRTQGIILAITPIISVILALVITFALTGSDAQVVVIEKEPGPDEAIAGYLTGLTEEDEYLFEVSDYSYSDESETLYLNVTVRNKVEHPILISNISYSARINGEDVIMALNETQEIMPNNSAEIMVAVNSPINKRPLDIGHEINITP